MNSKDHRNDLRDSKGRLVAGWDKSNTCSKCHNASIYYYEDYDAFFCASCNEWNEEDCSDPSCDYCASRPSKPLPLP